MPGAIEHARRVVIHATGDVFPDSADGLEPFRHVRELLSSADIVTGNCEGVYSDRPARAPSHRKFMAAPRARGALLGQVPFHVMSLANNHALDGGYSGLEDTIDLLRSQGIEVTGAGLDLETATRPAILERNGVRVAFLAFCSVFPAGYEARPDRPGLAPLRVRTFYADPDPTFWEPGIAPLIKTEPMPDDLRRFRAAIADASVSADFVVVACHWGYSHWLDTLQDYELELARDAVDHGADVVLCHHHHSLRGVEVRNGRPIFYGLGAFVHHFVGFRPSRAYLAARHAAHGERSSVTADDVFPLFPFRAEARQTAIAVVELGTDGSVRAGLVPAIILADGSTAPLAAGDPRATEVARYLERLSAGFDTTLADEERDGLLLLRVARAAPGVRAT